MINVLGQNLKSIAIKVKHTVSQAFILFSFPLFLVFDYFFKSWNFLVLKLQTVDWIEFVWSILFVTRPLGTLHMSQCRQKLIINQNRCPFKVCGTLPLKVTPRILETWKKSGMKDKGESGGQWLLITTFSLFKQTSATTGISFLSSEMDTFIIPIPNRSFIMHKK